MKLNATNRNTLRAIVIVIVLLCVLAMLRTSGYQGKEVEIETINTGSLFDIPSTEDCLKTAYYSDSKGGVCDGQKLVHEQASYKMK
ncbi:hypothetical protein [Bathycoccus sp. RCC716 virus 1]|uniref:Uncharacterized protein n=1 Tax=Bathycoccus sp. RCC716 virus 1 TaxID=2530038 RepID=A0A7S6SW59_9PHYC|nr:hypothetical protein [Bathycoccus sp. RCC716 virus 1]